MFGALVGRLWKIGRFGIRPPAPAPNRNGLAVVLIVRDEARHVREWADFHARAGVKAFFVYDDGSTDGTLEILQETIGDRLTVLPWAQRLYAPGLNIAVHNQVLAYAHAASNFGGAFRWMAFIDIDEFLIPKRATTLDDALSHLAEHRNLSLPWHMFGHSGHREPPTGGVLSNYLLRARDPMSDLRGVRAFKCIVDPCHLTAVGVHAMETGGSDKTCNDRGECVPLRDRAKSSFYSAEHIQLNHYYARSQAELTAKISRGPNLTGKASAYERKVRRTVSNIEQDQVEDRAALDYLARIGAE